MRRRDFLKGLAAVAGVGMVGASPALGMLAKVSPVDKGKSWNGVPVGRQLINAIRQNAYTYRSGPAACEVSKAAYDAMLDELKWSQSDCFYIDNIRVSVGDGEIKPLGGTAKLVFSFSDGCAWWIEYADLA